MQRFFTTTSAGNTREAILQLINRCLENKPLNHSLKEQIEIRASEIGKNLITEITRLARAYPEQILCSSSDEDSSCSSLNETKFEDQDPIRSQVKDIRTQLNTAIFNLSILLDALARINKKLSEDSLIRPSLKDVVWIIFSSMMMATHSILVIGILKTVISMQIFLPLYGPTPHLRVAPLEEKVIIF